MLYIPTNIRHTWYHIKRQKNKKVYFFVFYKLKIENIKNIN